jgi:hypothetical protein
MRAAGDANVSGRQTPGLTRGSPHLIFKRGGVNPGLGLGFARPDIWAQFHERKERSYLCSCQSDTFKLALKKNIFLTFYLDPESQGPAFIFKSGPDPHKLAADLNHCGMLQCYIRFSQLCSKTEVATSVVRMHSNREGGTRLTNQNPSLPSHIPSQSH